MANHSDGDNAPVGKKDSRAASIAQAISKAMSHPLLLLIAGAVLSGFLLPHVSHEWQVHAEELEVKDELVEEINDSLVRFVMEMRFGQDQRALQAAYRDWSVRKEQITTKISVYFGEDSSSGKKLHEDWADYSTKINELYRLTREGRNEFETTLEQHFSTDGLELLVSPSPTQNVKDEYHRTWEKLLDSIIVEKGKILEDVIAANSRL